MGVSARYDVFQETVGDTKQELEPKISSFIYLFFLFSSIPLPLFDRSVDETERTAHVRMQSGN